MDELFYIPTGDYLRQILGNSLVKPKDVRDILKRRGVFSSSNDKKHLVPLLVKTGVSPEEFLSLKDSIKTKEENPKVQTRKVPWISDCSLLEAMPEDFEFFDLIDDPFGIISISNNPVFVAAEDGSNPNHLIAEIEILRKDQTQNFGEIDSFHKCSLELKIDDSDKDLDITIKHSSRESLNYLNKVSRALNKRFKDEGVIETEKTERVLFDSFDNEGRINFLMDLSASDDVRMTSGEVKKIHISPDNKVGDIPKSIDWIEENIEDLMLQGKDLADSIFIKKIDYRKYFKIYTLFRRYAVNPGANEGVCVIKYYFVESGDGSSSELAMEVENLNLKKKIGVSDKAKIKMDILKKFDKKKIELLRKYAK